MKQHATAIFVIAYASMATATFGHAAAAAEKESQKAAASCAAMGKTRYCNGAIEVPAINGLAAAIIWPLYWSWELQA